MLSLILLCTTPKLVSKVLVVVFEGNFIFVFYV